MIEMSEMSCTPMLLGGGRGGDVKIFILLGWGGGGGGGGVLGTLKENLKLHNPSIKSFFRISSLIYFRCIRNTH